MRKINKVFILLYLLLPSFGFSADAQPWRIDQMQLTPDWLSLSGQHRSRYETLNNQFRNGLNGGDQALVFRTTVRADIKLESARFVSEMMDSRAEFVDTDTPLNTGIVNPLELLQAYVEVPFNDFFTAGSLASFRGGRITMDIGSRRFVARNRFRNTINGFTGVDWQWQGSAGQSFRTFYTYPVQRRVSGNILDNDAKFDSEHKEVKFWGLYYSPAMNLAGMDNEYYLFGLDEDDVSGVWNTRNRKLYTMGLRLHSAPTINSYHFEIESALQIGESRASTTAANDLDHFAYFLHLEAGYSFAAVWSPQLLFQYDYASGDDNANDSDNNRFDTLYGARRFEFGPTGIFGAFARSNINSPGLRLKLKPAKQVSSFFAIRGFWLASSNDSWTTAGIQNLVGQSDKYIGTQIEARLRYELKPDNIRVEFGGAHLFAGDVMNNAGKTDSTYFYSQVSFKF